MISVCLASFNGEKYIREQINSILIQLNKEDELIISDDGSTDKTIEIINEFNDNRIKLLHHIKNPELSKIKFNRNYYYAADNFENALKEAKGNIIFLSDQDDLWAAEKVRKITGVLNKGYDLVLTNFSTIDSQGKTINSKGFSKNPVKKTLLGKVIKSRFIGSSMAFTKEMLLSCMPFPNKLRAHDLWIGCFAKNIYFLDEPLTLYRRHESNVSTGVNKSVNPIWYRIYYRIKFLVQYWKY